MARVKRVESVPVSVAGGFDDLVGSMRRAGAVLDTAFNARCALGRALAVKIDSVAREPDDKSLAGLAREYRALVAEIVGEVGPDADDDTFGSFLSPTVRDEKKS